MEKQSSFAEGIDKNGNRGIPFPLNLYSDKVAMGWMNPTTSEPAVILYSDDCRSPRFLIVEDNPAQYKGVGIYEGLPKYPCRYCKKRKAVCDASDASDKL